jgi:hypothetical protein
LSLPVRQPPLRRIALACAAATLAAVLGGCSAQPHTAADAKLADSYTALIQEKLDGTLTEFETDVLERALDRGTISQSDYEAAHEGYRECMTQHGVSTEQHRFPNGVIHSTPPGPDDDHTVEQLAELDHTCAGSTIFVIDELAPESFGRDEFESAFGPGHGDYTDLPFDVKDERVQMCLFTAHIVIGFAE